MFWIIDVMRVMRGHRKFFNISNMPCISKYYFSSFFFLNLICSMGFFQEINFETKKLFAQITYIMQKYPM